MENQRVTKTRSPVEPDSVDASLDVWGRELPDLDLGIEGIVERIDKLKHYVDRAMQETLEAYDLSHGEWKLLADTNFPDSKEEPLFPIGHEYQVTARSLLLFDLQHRK